MIHLLNGTVHQVDDDEGPVLALTPRRARCCSRSSSVWPAGRPASQRARPRSPPRSAQQSMSVNPNLHCRLIITITIRFLIVTVRKK
jgi:hypothetical protein